MKTYAISDIHGCYKTLIALLEKISFSKSDELYLLGDYINKGKRSKEVLDFLIKLKSDGYNITTLKGNHEEMIFDSLLLEDWVDGAPETLKSFNINHLKELDDIYIKWFSFLKYYAIKDNFIFVHAGLNFTKPNPLEDKQAMLWLVNWYNNINFHWLKDKVIIHGHQSISISEIKKQIKKCNQNRVVNIDNGCTINKLGLGNLCCLEVNSMEVTFQKKID